MVVVNAVAVLGEDAPVPVVAAVHVAGTQHRRGDAVVGEGGDVILDVSTDLLRRQVTLIGSWTFSTVGQAECARYIADRGLEVDRLFTHRWRLEQAEEGAAGSGAAAGTGTASTERAATGVRVRRSSSSPSPSPRKEGSLRRAFHHRWRSFPSHSRRLT